MSPLSLSQLEKFCISLLSQLSAFLKSVAMPSKLYYDCNTVSNNFLNNHSLLYRLGYHEAITWITLGYY